MKKQVLTVAALFSLLFANDSLFTGTWSVEDEGITLTFATEDSVSFSSEDDESINGTGTYSFDDTTLTAVLDNEGMAIEVVYAYKTVEEGVSVVTKSLKLNGEDMETNDDEMLMVRSEEVSTEDEESVKEEE